MKKGKEGVRGVAIEGGRDREREGGGGGGVKKSER